MLYEIEFSSAAQRQFRKLPRDIQLRLTPAIDGLAANPRRRGAKKLTGLDMAYRLRVGEYRILYEIHDRQVLVLIIAVGHRREVYEL